MYFYAHDCIYLYTFKKNYRRISNAKKSPHTYHVADVCSHREIEHASEVNEGKFECYQTWFLSYSKSNFSWKMKRGDKRTYICSIYTFLVLPPPTNHPLNLEERLTTYLASRSFVILELLIFYVTKLNWTLQMFTRGSIDPLNNKTNAHYNFSRFFWWFFSLFYFGKVFDDFFDKFFWRIFLTNLFDEYFWQIFLTKFFVL